MRTLLRALIASALLTTAVAPAAFADGPTINGSGSTWSAIAIDQWRADVGNKRGLTVNYNSVGSSSGRQYYIALGDQTDFAVSEIPFVGSELDELKAHNRTFQYLPIVAGGTAMMYNLKTVPGDAFATCDFHRTPSQESSPGSSRSGVTQRLPRTMVVRYLTSTSRR